MGYQSRKEKITKFIGKNIVPALEHGDLDFYKVVSVTASDLGVSISMVEEELKTFVGSNKIKEIRILTIPDKQFKSWIERVREREKELDKIDEDFNKFKEKEKENENAGKQEEK